MIISLLIIVKIRLQFWNYLFLIMMIRWLEIVIIMVIWRVWMEL
jgi:hypothetical protein